MIMFIIMFIIMECFPNRQSKTYQIAIRNLLFKRFLNTLLGFDLNPTEPELWPEYQCLHQSCISITQKQWFESVFVKTSL